MSHAEESTFKGDRSRFRVYFLIIPKPEPMMSSIVNLRQPACEPGQPLWQRVPTRDDEGRNLHDFMMFIPKLGSWPESRRQQVYQELQRVFNIFDGNVVFADLNLKLNLLWVSMQPHPEGCLGLAAAVRDRVPEAVLVASQAEVIAGMANGERRRRWGRFLLR